MLLAEIHFRNRGLEDSLKPESQDNRTQEVPTDRSQHSTPYSCKAKYPTVLQDRMARDYRTETSAYSNSSIYRTDRGLDFFSPIITLLLFCFCIYTPAFSLSYYRPSSGSVFPGITLNMKRLVSQGRILNICCCAVLHTGQLL